MKQVNFILWLVVYLCVYTNVTAQDSTTYFNKLFQADTANYLSGVGRAISNGYVIAGDYLGQGSIIKLYIQQLNENGEQEYYIYTKHSFAIFFCKNRFFLFKKLAQFNKSSYLCSGESHTASSWWIPPGSEDSKGNWLSGVMWGARHFFVYMQPKWVAFFVFGRIKRVFCK